jgi:outer membrane protein OmpA-like peptidoglycan-associated protein
MISKPRFLAGAVFATAATALMALAPGYAQTTPPAPPAAPAAPAAAPALPPPSPIEQAFEKAATDVLTNAKVPGGARIDLLIDPLVDGNTGAQSSSTRRIEAQLRQLVAAKFSDKFQVQPFTTENVARSPFVFIGTFTPIHATAQAVGPRDAFRICFAIVDLKAGQIVSKGFARATTQGVNPVPTSAFADSPIWVKDPSVDGYVRTCQGTKAGDPINAAYLERISVASVISDAIKAYDERRYKDALDLYTKARAMPGGDQLRVFNGLYLSSAKLNRKADTDKALGELVDFGIKNERLGVMMLFVPSTTQFVPGSISQSYPAWLKAIADKAASRNVCLELVGHASQTGTEAFNDRLSAQRAEAVRDRIARVSPAVAKSVKSSGKGWRENIVGTGRDDATDALDRRVEFKVAKCAA